MWKSRGRHGRGCEGGVLTTTGGGAAALSLTSTASPPGVFYLALHRSVHSTQFFFFALYWPSKALPYCIFSLNFLIISEVVRNGVKWAL